jgi:hypothetical protein
VGTISDYSNTTALMPTVRPAHLLKIPMSAMQFDEYLLQRDGERRKELVAKRFALKRRGGPGAGAGDDDGGQSYRTLSRAICTFVFPPDVPRPYRADVRAMLDDGDDDDERDDDDEGGPDGAGAGAVDRAAKAGAAINRKYGALLAAAMAKLAAQPGRLACPATAPGPGAKGGLDELSPKFGALVRHLRGPDAAPGPAIVYSQFRTAEGLGLLSLALNANGFAELRVVRTPGAGAGEPGGWTLQLHPPGAPRHLPRYIVYDNKDADASDIMLRIFRSELDALPPGVTGALEELHRASSARARSKTARGGDARARTSSNLHGELVRLLLITQSGSEGISTRNVREVHVLEPFWHANRIQQVLGRAVRSRSHEALPPAERFVDFYMYMASLTPDQKADPTVARLDRGMTSDEHLFGVAQRKRKLLDQVVALMRRAAVDCTLHHPKKAADRCYAPPAATPPGAAAYELALEEDIAGRRRARLRVVKGADGRTYLQNPESGELYDHAAFKADGALVAVPAPAGVLPGR